MINKTDFDKCAAYFRKIFTKAIVVFLDQERIYFLSTDKKYLFRTFSFKKWKELNENIRKNS